MISAASCTNLRRRKEPVRRDDLVAARTEEFEQLEDEIQEESEHREQLRRQMTMLRRIIRKSLHDAHLYGSNNIVNDLQTQFENHLAHMPNRKECPEVCERLPPIVG